MEARAQAKQRRDSADATRQMDTHLHLPNNEILTEWFWTKET